VPATHSPRACFRAHLSFLRRARGGVHAGQRSDSGSARETGLPRERSLDDGVDVPAPGMSGRRYCCEAMSAVLEPRRVDASASASASLSTAELPRGAGPRSFCHPGPHGSGQVHRSSACSAASSRPTSGEARVLPLDSARATPKSLSRRIGYMSRDSASTGTLLAARTSMFYGGSIARRGTAAHRIREVQSISRLSETHRTTCLRLFGRLKTARLALACAHHSTSPRCCPRRAHRPAIYPVARRDLLDLLFDLAGPRRHASS